LSFKIASLPASGTLYDPIIGPITSVGTTLSGATVTYVPASNYNGSASFDFKANDGSVDSSSATVSLAVTPVNDAPAASADDKTLAEDGSATVTVSGSDIEAAAADLQFKITDAPSHGTLSKSGTDLAAGDTFTASPKDLLYTPNANFNGSDSFKFEVADRGDPDNCGSASSSCADLKTDSKTVSLTVTPVNDAPSASADDKTLAEDGSATVT